jgi:hypothetical protein
MFVLAQNAQLIESKAQAEPANDMAGAPGRRFRSWLQNINHQTDNAPWVTKRQVTPGAKTSSRTPAV